MDLIFSASILAAFLAGAVALFAPCCITVLLPAYLGSAFREKKDILKMTFIFFAGIAVILVPIGLGAASLARVFRDFHQEMYLVGGLLMVLLAVLAFQGRGLALFPRPEKMGLKLNPSDAKSVFLLGIFSGAATSCCAPVLAGAVTLAVISGAFWKALVVTFAYVFGLTFPLFVTAYFYDRCKLDQSRFIRGKLLEWKIGAKKIYVHTTNLLAATMFLLMGLILLWLALSHNAFWAPSFQVTIGERLNKWSGQALAAMSVIPEFVWGFAVIGLFLFFLSRAHQKNIQKESDHNHNKPPCH